jgi:hypothetical protein
MKQLEEDCAPLKWRKSSFSGSSGCVEVARSHDRVFVRDSKDSSGAVVEVTTHDWKIFLEGVLNGEFSLEQLSENDK